MPLFGRLSLPERRWVAEALRDETVGGLLLLAAAVVALVWANSPAGDSYAALAGWEVGPAALGLHLSLATWAADGLLAIFFFVAGMELKHELVLGSLRRVGKAAVPVAAAVGGMAVPALIFAGVNLAAPDGSPGAWGIPMATDIAFALAVLAVVGSRLPVALRAFLLTLAVVDDLGAIVVIAVFYSHGFNAWAFLAAVACLIGYALLQHWRVRTPWIYLPLALVTWDLMHASGIHATVAGVAMGLLTRVRADPGEAAAPCDRLIHRVHPVSAAVAVPLFAFFAAGVDLRGTDLATTLSSPITIGIVVGLVVGKPVGVVGTAWLMARFTRASLDPSIGWRDVGAVGLVAGIGFTVSLLIAALSFGDDPSRLATAKLAVLLASVTAAVVAAAAILGRNRHYRRRRTAPDPDTTTRQPD